MRKLLITILVVISCSLVFGAISVDYIGVIRQKQVGGGPLRQYMFQLPRGAGNAIVFEAQSGPNISAATAQELAGGYCYVRYNTNNKKIQKRTFWDTLDEAEDEFIAEGGGTDKKFKGNVNKWVTCTQ